MNTPPPRTRTSRVDRIPPTPLHGARFDSPPPPTSRKAKCKGENIASSSSSSYSTATLSPPPSSPLGPDESIPLPKQTYKSRKRRASVLDEPADKTVEVESEGWKELEKVFGKDFGRGLTAVPSGAGLPTPSKTPARKRKHISIDSVAGSARRLFGSSSFAPATSVAKNILGSMPHGGKKRLGRFDLTGEDGNDSGSISIFTDNNARIPKYDPSPENPFITRKESIKERKKKLAVSKSIDIDTLGDDGRREDGMVYVFRGKKMFRKFIDMDEPDEPLPVGLPAFPTLGSVNGEEEGFYEEGEEVVGEEVVGEEVVEEEVEEEEVVEEEEEEEINAILNKRSSIRPRLLFPSKISEFKVSKVEEAETDVEDIEDNFAAITAEIIEKKKEKEIDRNAISRLTPDSDDDFSSDSKKGRVRFEDNIFGSRGDIPKSVRKKPCLFDDKQSRKPTNELFKDLEDGGRVVRVKRSRQDAFAGSLSPPRAGKKAKDLLS